jgi:aminoglycoside 3-N-acetyltransferase
VTVRLRDLLLGLKDLRLGAAPVIVHASLSAFGEVEDGPETVVQALISVFEAVLVPTFTYRTMILPEVGPPNNGLTYGTGTDQNRLAEFFTPNLPADKLMGIVAETLRQHPRTQRSDHPIQSFAGINANKPLTAQALKDPLAPLRVLGLMGGWAVLMGVDNTTNTSIHYAEKLAGRHTFIRWALTPRGVVECPGFPGCSAGFEAIAPEMEKYSRRVEIGSAIVRAMPLKMLFRVVSARVKEDPLALLCQQEDCLRCGQIRKLVGEK